VRPKDEGRSVDYGVNLNRAGAFRGSGRGGRGGGSLRRMGLARVFGALGAGQRAEDDIEVAVSQHLGGRVRLAIKGDVFDEPVHDFEADLLVRFLAPAKTQLHPDFHFIAKKPDGLVALGGEVVRVNGGRDLNFFHSARGRAGVGFSFGFLVQEFPIIHDAAHGRRGIGGDLDEVQAFGLGQFQGVIERHDAQLLFGIVDDPDFAGADFPVAAMQRFAGMK
jgi:hypothetical protein